LSQNANIFAQNIQKIRTSVPGHSGSDIHIFFETLIVVTSRIAADSVLRVEREREGEERGGGGWGK
jgi:hypothetical protein